MAKPGSTADPISAEAREQILTVIRLSAKPLTAKLLSTWLPAPHEIPEKRLSPVLDEYVAAGTLRAYPSKTGRGKPSYWDRDVAAIGRVAALETVQRADVPLTAKEAAVRIKAPVKFTETELSSVLDEYVAVAKLHEISPATAKGKKRYWNHDALDFGRQAILRALEALGTRTEKQLRSAAKGLSDAQFQQVLHRAISAGEVGRHPPLGKAKTPCYGKGPPSPEPYLREIGDQLATIVTLLTEASVPQADLRRVLVQLVESAGVPFASAAPTSADTSARMVAAPVDLIALMRRIEPGADRGALVGSRDLRRAARLGKSEFDCAVLELARNGRLSLHRHDYAASLSPAERDELVTDGAGTHYVGMALRQSVGRA